jgi:hypothetical protein
MLAVLRDPECEQSRRDAMAIQLAPYLHPRLAAVGVTTTNGNGGSGGGDINIVQILAVPRGARLSKDGTVMLDGEVTALKPISPYEPTPPLELTDQSEPAAPLPEPLPVIEMTDDGKVVSLRRWSSDDESDPGAA